MIAWLLGSLVLFMLVTAILIICANSKFKKSEEIRRAKNRKQINQVRKKYGK